MSNDQSIPLTSVGDIAMEEAVATTPGSADATGASLHTTNSPEVKHPVVGQTLGTAAGGQ